MNKPTKRTSLPATNSGPRLTSFPLGSLESRMAMREEVERAKREPKPMVRIFNVDALTCEYECEDMDVDLIATVSNVRIDDCGPEDAHALPEPSMRHERDDKRTLAVPPAEASQIIDNAAVEEPQPSQPASSKQADAPDNDQSEREHAEAAREARVEEYGRHLARRSHTGPSPQLRRAWWRHGL